MTATSAATEIVADVAEEVAGQAQYVAEVSRGISGRGMGFAVGAFLLGSGIGGGLAYLFAIRRLETKYSQISADEIAEMQEHYKAKYRAVEAKAQKRPVEEIVKERGYSSPDITTSAPPMAVQPPSAVLETETSDDDSEMSENDVEGPNGVKNVFKTARETVVEREWNWHEERKRRSPDIPYVIHYDERDAMEGYSQVSLTYYAGDDVLCDDRDDIIDPIADRNRLVGENNLELFGHGSQDPSIVYVRNDTLEIVYEIVKSPNTYAEEVAGFSHEAYDRGNLQRMRKRERDEQDY